MVECNNGSNVYGERTNVMSATYVITLGSNVCKVCTQLDVLTANWNLRPNWATANIEKVQPVTRVWLTKHVCYSKSVFVTAGNKNIIDTRPNTNLWIFSLADENVLECGNAWSLNPSPRCQHCYCLCLLYTKKTMSALERTDPHTHCGNAFFPKTR